MVGIEDLERFNPWWKSGKVREEWLKEYKRKVYFEIEKYIDKRQIILIWGLRRVGKTTLLFQLIQKLLDSNVNPKFIFYFSFDEISFDLKEVLEAYQKLILNKTFDEIKERVYIFLDEVHKVKDWENKIKVYYDLYPNIKFFIAGSASISLRRKSKESLAGRVIDFLVKPLSFEEFLEMKGKDVKKIKENPDLWKRELIPLFYQYLKYGSFPELVNESDEEFAKKYILNNVIERIIYKDIPSEFGIKDVELLKNIVYVLAKNPGMIVSYKEFAKNFGRDQRTISNYFEYLEFGLIIKLLYNYRGSSVASFRKLKKAYFTTPNIIFALNDNLDRVLPFMLENAILMETDSKFFYKNNFEVDFVLFENLKIIPIEVKKNEKDFEQLKKFIEKFGEKVKKGILITFEQDGKIDEIEVIPAWKFALLKDI